MKVVWLGRIGFSEALKAQSDALEHCDRTGEETLFLLEHEPVYTIGRRLDKSSLGNTAYLPHPVFEINRGGQATSVSPGKLVGLSNSGPQKTGQGFAYLLAERVENAVIHLVERPSGSKPATAKGRRGLG